MFTLPLWYADLSESHSHGSDGVVMWPTLQGGEDGEVDFVLKVVHDILPLLVHGANTLTIEDEASPEQDRIIYHFILSMVI